MKYIDLSFCNGLLDASPSFSLSSLPISLHKLSLHGIMFQDSATLTKAIVRLTSLRHIKLCGIPAITDEAIEEVFVYRDNLHWDKQRCCVLIWIADIMQQHQHPVSSLRDVLRKNLQSLTSKP